MGWIIQPVDVILLELAIVFRRCVRMTHQLVVHLAIVMYLGYPLLNIQAVVRGNVTVTMPMRRKRVFVMVSNSLVLAAQVVTVPATVVDIVPATVVGIVPATVVGIVPATVVDIVLGIVATN